jgi:hypothetical protein
MVSRDAWNQTRPVSPPRTQGASNREIDAHPIRRRRGSGPVAGLREEMPEQCAVGPRRGCPLGNKAIALRDENRPSAIALTSYDIFR